MNPLLLVPNSSLKAGQQLHGKEKNLIIATGISLCSCSCFNSEIADRGYSVSRVVYGHTSDGKQVELYTISNGKGLKAAVMTLGATLTTVSTPDKNGKSDIITLHKDSFEEYTKGHPLFGSIVGRYANRIANASFTRDDTAYKLEKNAGEHHIHGGGRKTGFACQVWKAEPLLESNTAGVKLTLASPNGQAGFPGNLKVTVLYKLTKDNRLILNQKLCRSMTV